MSRPALQNTLMRLTCLALVPWTAACGTMPWSREAPLPVVIQTPPPVIPAECFTDPQTPDPLEAPILPELVARGDPNYLAIRTRRAELAGQHFQAERDEERRVREANAGPQQVCANWARRAEAQQR